MGEDKQRNGGPSMSSTSSGSNFNNASAPSASTSEYTQEQVEAVRKIRRSKDFYEILGVSKNCNEADLKKQYRKLALQFHPDKNKAPGASKAFKAISNAFEVLSNLIKRENCELSTSQDPPVSEQQRAHDDETRRLVRLLHYYVMKYY